MRSYVCPILFSVSLQSKYFKGRLRPRVLLARDSLAIAGFLVSKDLRSEVQRGQMAYVFRAKLVRNVQFLTAPVTHIKHGKTWLAATRVSRMAMALGLHELGVM